MRLLNAAYRKAAVPVQLAVGALLANRAATVTSVALVSVSVWSVVGAQQAFRRVASVVTSLVESDAVPRAIVDLSRCAQCAPLARQSLSQLPEVEAVRQTRIRIRDERIGAFAGREVPVLCVAPTRAPLSTRWRNARARDAWVDAVGSAQVVLGADIAREIESISHVPATRRPAVDSLNTAGGTWILAGTLTFRPPLSASAAENRSLLVPDRPPFDRLCARGTTTWRIAHRDTVALRASIGAVEEALRTGLQLRPGTPPPWRILRTDHFAELVGRIASRFERWLMVAPLALALLCGAGVFSVQTLHGDQRIEEFGVRRAVGASRRDLLGQLVVEALLTGATGALLAVPALIVVGLSGQSSVDWLHGMRLALAVALPLVVLGLLVPGVTALRAASIAQLEGRG